jgi:transcription initiation factor TFIID subunit 2
LVKIDFQKKAIYGFTELTLHPLVDDLSSITLNLKQCKIFTIVINKVNEAPFEFCDPLRMKIGGNDDSRRDLHVFLASEELAGLSVDADEGNGELSITIPESCRDSIKKNQPLSVAIEFCLEEPKGGIRFLSHNDETSNGKCDFNEVLMCTTIDHNPHYWFPCVNSYNELCTWKIEVVVEEDLNVVASGNLIECEDLATIGSELGLDGSSMAIGNGLKKYHYFLSTPTCAPNIGLCVGCFDSLSDESMPEVSYYFENVGLEDLVKQTTNSLHEVFEFYEDLFSISFQHTSYKQVYVSNILEDYLTFSGLTIMNVNVLHPTSALDQAIKTKKLMSQVISQQFFGSFLTMNNMNEWWLITGLASFYSGLYVKKLFGNNEYKYMLHKKMKEVCTFEREQGQIVLDFNYAGQVMGSFKESFNKHQASTQYSYRYHLMGAPDFYKAAQKKAHLVVRLIDDCIGHETMLQLINKMFNLAINSVQERSTWTTFLISIESFLSLLCSFSSKDIKQLLELWVYKPGIARLHGTYTFNRKKNSVEIDVKQDMASQRGYRKYVGPITIVIQEIDGSFTHNLQIEDSNSTKFELACHSKGKKNKKKKIPLFTGEEVDIDTSNMDSDSPILWIRLDSDLKILRELKFEQPDISWQHQLKYERDICAQLDAVEVLIGYATVNTKLALTSVLENNECFYRVRIKSAFALSQVVNKMIHSSGSGPLPLIGTFKKLFFAPNCPNIVSSNNFGDLQLYFIQKSIPVAMGSLRNNHNLCPSEIVKFLIDLVKYNENSRNTHSDCCYRAALIDAISSTVSSPSTFSSTPNSSSLSQDSRLIIEEIVLRLNLEKLLPTHRYVITSACLKALSNLQKLGHIPENIDIFKQYTNYKNTYEDVRMVAFEIIIEHLEVRNGDDQLLEYLFKFVETDPSYSLRQHIMQHLCKHPPFKLNSEEASLNTEMLVTKLWRYLTEFAYNSSLKASIAELYCTLYGLNRPKCLKYQTTKETYKVPNNFIAPISDFNT